MENNITKTNMNPLNTKDIDGLSNSRSSIVRELIKMQLQIHKEQGLTESSFKNKLSLKYQNIFSSANEISSSNITDPTIMMEKIMNFILSNEINGPIKEEIQTQKEIRIALESVLPQNSVITFIQMSPNQKYDQLLEITKIVLGIKKYNRFSENISSQNYELNNSINEVKDIENDILLIQKSVRVLQNKIKSLHKNYFQPSYQEDKDYQIFSENTASLSTFSDDLDFIEEIKESLSDPEQIVNTNKKSLEHQNSEEKYFISRLAMLIQYLTLLRNTKQSLALLSSQLESKNNEMIEIFSNVSKVIDSNAAVNKQQVYPRFRKLGILHFETIDEILFLKSIISIYEKLRNEYRDIVMEQVDPINTLAEEKEGDEQEEEASKADMKNKIVSDETSIISNNSDLFTEKLQQNDCKLWLLKNNPHLLSTINLSLQGYCIWSVVSIKGLMLEGNPDLGIVEYDNSFYTFVNSTALKEFVQKPAYYIEQLKMLISKNSEHLYLLQASSLFPDEFNLLFPSTDDENIDFNSFDHSKVINDQLHSDQKCDASTETPTHFVDKYIDYHYYWNEWDARRQILKVVNLTKCKTRAQQTINTHFRRDNASQVYLPKDNVTQTKRETGTNPKKVTTYIAGLRGKKDPNARDVLKYAECSNKSEITSKGAKVVTLTLDL
jgi:hypothetical protein